MCAFAVKYEATAPTTFQAHGVHTLLEDPPIFAKVKKVCSANFYRIFSCIDFWPQFPWVKIIHRMHWDWELTALPQAP